MKTSNPRFFGTDGSETPNIQSAVEFGFEDSDWKLKGNCASRDIDPEMFFMGKDIEGNYAKIPKAVAICDGCPVTLKCFSSYDDDDHEWVVAGGQYPRGFKLDVLKRRLEKKAHKDLIAHVKLARRAERESERADKKAALAAAILSGLRRPGPPPGVRYKDFCSKGHDRRLPNALTPNGRCRPCKNAYAVAQRAKLRDASTAA